MSLNSRLLFVFFFFKQKTAYEVRISDWSSDVCSSDLFLNCFIDDAFGLKNIDSLNEDMVSYECDYPHSDTLWPEVPERLHETIKHLTEIGRASCRERVCQYV